MNEEPARDGTAYPAEFVSKLYRMLDNPEYSGIVCWSATKDSFIILNISAFQEKIIPKEFSHANFSSFVRQLNKYDFHKQRFHDANSRVWEFKHKDFRYSNRDRPQLIKRKTPSSRNQAFQETVEQLQGLLVDVQERLEKLEAENANMYHVVEKQDRMISMLMGEQNQVQVQSQAPPQQPQQPAPTPTVSAAHATPQAVPTPTTHPNQPIHSVATPSGHTTGHTAGHGAHGAHGAQSGHPTPTSSHTAVHATTMHPAREPRVAVAITDSSARNITASLLREYGCTVETTDSGVEVVRLAEVGSVSAIILEPVLTALDGVSATGMIRRINPQANIVFCVDKDQIAAGFTEAYYQARGASRVLWRPFSKQDLYNTLIAYL